MIDGTVIASREAARGVVAYPAGPDPGFPALLPTKGHALQNRLKQKDAYDIYYCIRNCPVAQTRSRGRADLSLNIRAPRAATVRSRRSSIASKARAPIVSAASCRTRTL
jgi:hypothetical protein